MENAPRGIKRIGRIFAPEDCFVQLAQRALRDVGGEAELVDEVTVVLEVLRADIMRKRYAALYDS